ncbi:MAG TPA: DUF3320 domain-containing protein [Actinomycetes bacterium]|nr:DUF3320 domain-containing protein [Actinomycetes bacterium]
MTDSNQGGHISGEPASDPHPPTPAIGLECDPADPVPAPDPVVRDAIRDWRDSLLNLAGTNRLLNFRPSKTSTIEVVQPAAADVLSALADQRALRFRSVPAPDSVPAPGDAASLGSAPAGPRAGMARPLPAAVPGVLDTIKDEDELAAALRLLARRSKQEYLDRGVWVLYLAIGMLRWTDDEGVGYASPLLLVPVRMVSTGLRRLPVLEVAEEDPVVNPALALKMGQYGVVLPGVDLLEDLSLDELLDEVRAAVADRPGWAVDASVVVSCFSFHKEAMYRDLIEHQHAIAGHPIVAALALGGRESTDGFMFDEIPDDRIDLDAPPETTPLVLDGDSHQRACIAAAVDGRSFVMDGPPGTGKSQTIANMIGVLLHAGRTVLFVSEKAAALEVVRNRLTDVGLGAYILELHSHKATRREVAAALGAALEIVPVPPEPMSAMAVAAVTRRRELLTAYADAMNVPRPPLGYSLHDVLGMIALLDEVPTAPTTGIAPVDLTVEVLERIQSEAAALADAWRPAVQGSSFVWRGVSRQPPADALLYQAASALERLVGLAGRNMALMAALDLRRVSDATRLSELLDLLAERPADVPAGWLTAPSLDEIHSTVHRLAGDVGAAATAEQAATRIAGISWLRLPDPVAVPDQEQEASPRPPVETEELTIEQAAELSETFAADADRLVTRIKSLRGITSMLGLRPAGTVSDARETLTVAEIAVKDDRPERAWLTPPGLTAAKAAAAAIRDAAERLETARSAARVYFTDAALSVDVIDLAARFERTHHGVKKLFGGYHADKRSVAAVTAGQVTVQDAIAHLDLAVEWQRAAAEHAAVATSHAGALGGYYTGPGTDLARVDRVLADAAVAVRRAAGVVIERDSVLADCLAADRESPPPPALADLIGGTRRDLEEWISRLAPGPAPAAPVELARWPLDEVVTWLREQAAALRLDADQAGRLSGAVGRPLTLGEAANILAAQAAARAAHAALAGRADEYTRVCQALYRGAATDTAAMQHAVAWTERARTIRSGTDTPFTATQVEALDTATATPLLADAAAGWQRVAPAVLAGFEPFRRVDLARELDDYTDAADLIAALRADSRGRDEWLAYTAARSALAARGLTVAIDFCESERLPAAQIPQVITKSVLQEWADHHLTRDPALQSTRTADRDLITTEFRELDRTLVASAVSKIITAVNGRRPRNDIGQSALIQREASKKRKHMPVRRLIDRTMHVVQAVKPCFMMSPLSVSQYLPADMAFDVVIFDEASQLMPGDAINCIYRGRSLITAGDQRQLPPTTFFTPTTDDPVEEWTEENENTKDFESIMDLVKAAGVFKSLPLRWHYRSRHEGLIAFSNTSFYNGSLVTFPGAEHHGQDVGVELFRVSGVYRRGSTRDNPVEAAKVAERVIHHFDTRPEMSLGVVTFSEPQAAAVEWAVELARLERPDLDRYFTDDRLDGFFVKNLESVQGDERDVMIFSVGYGPDENRKITMNFGPLNRPGGWRRLNVAITRARYRIEIVSSIAATDITEHAGSEGVRQLRRYLDYAERGVPALGLDDGAVTAERDSGSPFEQSVLAAIRSWGYEAVPRVGAAGYRIDIGVGHPERPGVYALGVECDGSAYHSARAARDRDRLRDQVLRGLGWRLHRVWGTAWHRDRRAEEAHLRAAIEAAVRAPDPVPGVDGPPEPIQRPAVSIEPVNLEHFGQWAVRYRIAAVDPLPVWVDVSEVGAHHEMRPAVREIVSVESPVHRTVLHQRLREAWQLGRLGARIQDNIDTAIRHSDLVVDGEFVLAPDQDPVTVRTPTEECARSLEQVHDRELAAAVVALVRDAGGIDQNELGAELTRLFGWTRRRQEIQPRLEPIVAELLAGGVLAGRPAALTRGTDSAADTAQPAAETDQPIADSDQPTAGTDQPIADSNQPTAGTDQPIGATYPPARSGPARAEVPAQAQHRQPDPAQDSPPTPAGRDVPS